MINFRPIARVIAVLLLLIGGLMFTGIPFSLYFDSGDLWALLNSGLICVVVGGALWLVKSPGERNIRKREGYLIVALGWLAMVTFGMLPYLLSGVIPDIVGAIFETVSGMTTTGASVLTDIEAAPEGILYWRSLTQWIGGMGIIVLTVAIFPLLGIGGIELFVAEAPGPTSDKLHPRIRETAKRLWQIYVGLTILLTGALLIAGLSFYEALNHALTTMATGGFSTKNASMAHYDLPAVQYPVIFFMFLAGTNYTVIYYGLKGRLRKVWQSDEFKAYLFLVVALTAIVTLGVRYHTGLGWEKSFRDSLFQIVSIVTTTGFVSADYTAWGNSLMMVFFVLMFLGACAGSTSGGIKLVRHLVFFKNSFLEFKRILHPRAVIPLKLNGQVVTGRILTHIIIFLLLYLFLFVIGSIIVAAMGLDFMTAVGAVATSLGNVGPGIGKVGPVDNFAWLSPGIKLFLSFLMLLGRLELFTILVLFTPYFWKSN
ncbi:TrkH family potassium uptake protein [Phaeodactylibacter luteus]|uniref:TrkH family potassium uptake protein n=1 Tax=Phaeodactylibacter luteus TaxID=1564516 RepID=A0A5C6RHE7_9BACT|nr:TrkH family potassium uptake protein [Phaeodactylibacter luteus]TXB61751.1 TrkH family potassium uptake protein [Phaeodactylibacter luteus]